MVDNVERRWRRRRRSVEQCVQWPRQKHHGDQRDSVRFDSGDVGGSHRGGVSVVETAPRQRWRRRRREIAGDCGNRGDSVERPSGVRRQRRRWRRQDRRNIFAALAATAATAATEKRLSESDRVGPRSRSLRSRRPRARHNDPTKLRQTIYGVDREPWHSRTRELRVNERQPVRYIIVL